jgi:hypothetical protein
VRTIYKCDQKYEKHPNSEHADQTDADAKERDSRK